MHKGVMVLEPRISIYHLMRYLLVTRERLLDWEKSRLLVGDAGAEHAASYSHLEVNALLERYAINFAEPPTVQQMIAGEIEWLKVVDAGEFLPPGKNVGWLRYKIDSGIMPALRIRTHIVVEKWSLVAFVDKWMKQSADFTLAQARHILGVSAGTLERAARNGKVVFTSFEGRRREKCVTRQHLVAVLREVLPVWIAAEDWIQDRTSSNEPLMSVSETATALGLTSHDIGKLIKYTVQLQFIKSLGGKNFMVLPESVRAYQLADGAFFASRLAKVFGVTRQRALAWGIQCPLHPNEQNHRLHRACLVEVLRPLCGPKTKPERWIAQRLVSKNDLLWEPHEAAALLRVTPEVIIKMATSGIVSSICTPDGVWMFSPSQIRLWRKKRR